MKDLSVGKESKLILHFATPMLLGNVFQQMYNVVDSLIVGNFIGKEALAAVGSSFPILFALISLMIGLAVGGTIIIAQYFGAKEIENVKRTIDTLLIVMFFASLIVSVIGITTSEYIFRLIQMPPDVIPDATKYFNIYISGAVLFFGFHSISAILRGLGDSKTPLYFLILSTVLNIILDILFVIVFKWGIEGVAIATIISQAFALVAAIIYLNKKHEIIKITFRKMIFDSGIFKKSMKIGLPIGLQQSFVALGMMVMYWLVNRFGTNVTAAYSVAFRIDSFAAMPAMNFANALSTFVGQNLGAGKPERIKSGLWATFRMTAIISISITLIAFLFSDEIMWAFIKDPEVISIGASYLKIVSGFYIVFSAMFVVGAVMRGAGDTIIPMIITFIALWIIRIPLCYFLSEAWGYTGIWWGIPIAWVVGLVLSYLYYLTGRWKRKVIIKA